jgi:hypothetical protein
MLCFAEDNTKKEQVFMRALVYHNHVLRLEKSYGRPDLQPGEALNSLDEGLAAFEHALQPGVLKVLVKM